MGNFKLMEKQKNTRIFIHCWWEYTVVQPLWKTGWQFLKVLNIELSWDPEIPLLGVYSGELKAYTHTKTCTQMFMVASFKIAKKLETVPISIN